MKNLKTLVATLALLAIGVTARGGLITITDGNAKADFVTGANTLSITLNNLTVDPTGVIQNISGLGFTLSSGQTSASLVSSWGKERTVNSDGTYADGATVAAGWVLSGLFLDDLLGAGHAGPAHTLIGAPNAGTGEYDAANNSITGNGPHNPFLVGPVTFNLWISGLTADDIVTGANFQWGTTPGGGTSVPDNGATFALLGMGLVGISFLSRRKILA